MNRARGLGDLSTILTGRSLGDPGWMDVVSLANKGLITPALHESLIANGDVLPEELSVFLDEVSRRTIERNRRMAAQLVEAARALDAAGVRPMLLKGMALWATLGADRPFARIMSDIDLLVQAKDVPAAIDALSNAGLGLLHQKEGPDVHVIAEFGRSSDVGLIDLHQRAPGPPALAQTAFDESAARTMTFMGVDVLVPSPARQIFHLALHDQMHDGDFWRGGFDLRHLIDIAKLTTNAAIDWEELEAMCGTALMRSALGAQLLAAEAIAGASIGAGVRQWPRAAIHAARHRAQFLNPLLRMPLALAALAYEAKNVAAHRANIGLEGSGQLPQRTGAGPRSQRFRQILTVGPGKL